MGSVTAAEVLSPSQATQFLHCPAKWYFRYFLDVPKPVTAATALGKAFHETIACNFRQKIQTNADLPIGDSLGHFRNYRLAARDSADGIDGSREPHA
jgi:hypothetical protein